MVEYSYIYGVYGLLILNFFQSFLDILFIKMVFLII